MLNAMSSIHGMIASLHSLHLLTTVTICCRFTCALLCWTGARVK